MMAKIIVSHLVVQLGVQIGAGWAPYENSLSRLILVAYKNT
jgi:hypothetical protein